MTITSKYNSKCKKCNGHIAIGQQIEWDKETGPRHTVCPASSSPRPAGERARGEGRVPDDPRRPYHGKFRLLKEAHDTVEAAEGAAELDAEYAGITRPAPRPAVPLNPLARISAYLEKLPPLDALAVAAAVLQVQQHRIDAQYRTRPALAGAAR